LTRVLIVHSSSNSGLVSGEAIAINNDIESLKLFCDPKYLNLEIESQGLRGFLSRLLGLSFSWKSYSKVREAIKDFNPDVIHFHTTIPYSSLSVFFAGSHSKIPIVVSLHNARLICVEGGLFRNQTYCEKCVNGNRIQGVIHGCSQNVFVSLLNYLNVLFFDYFFIKRNKIKKLITVSDFVKNTHIAAGFCSDLLTVRNNGLRINSERVLKPYSDRVGIVYAGRISVAKGAKVLKHLMLNCNYPIHVIGNGPELDELKLFCESRSLEKVCFYGAVSNDKAINIMSKAKVCVVPSQCGDSFPTSAIEALSVGTPIVVSNLGGLPDIISASKAGFVVPHDDDKAFCEAVKKLYEDKDLGVQLGINGFRYASEKLNLTTTGSALFDIYKSVC